MNTDTLAVAPSGAATVTTKPARGRDVATAAAAATPKAGNMSLSDLTTMLQKPKPGSTGNSSTSDASAADPAAPGSEHPAGTPGKAAPRKRKVSPSAAPAASTPVVPAETAPAEAEAELGGDPLPESETPAPATETEVETETEAETPEAGELGGEETSEETETAPEGAALPPELADAIAEAKAAGNGAAAKLLKRLHRLVDQRDTERMTRLQAEQAITQLQQQLQSAQSARPESPAGGVQDRFAGHPDVAPLLQQIEQAQNVIAWAEENADGVEMEKDGHTRTFTADEVRQIRRKAENTLTQANGDRAAQVALLTQQEKVHRTQFNAQARTLYPWLQVKTSPEYQEAVQTLAAFPTLKQAPGLEMILGRYVTGLKAERARMTAAGQPAARTGAPRPATNRTAPAVTTAAAATAPRPSRASATVKEAEDNFKKSGSKDALANLFANRIAARKAA